MSLHRVRRSQTVSPFGVGAIIDLVGESFVAADAGEWRQRTESVRMPRLAGYLGVPDIRTPWEKGSLPYYRFPQWLFCPTCRRMERWSTRLEKKGVAPRCLRCAERSRLVPMRFVAACGNGHLCDVDWRWWAHSARPAGAARSCRDGQLLFRTVPGVGSGLQSTEVYCAACRASRSLRDLPGKDGLSRVGQKCPGRQPWQDDDEAQICTESLSAVQRGASSVYFPRVESAIDIPPNSDWATRNSPAARLADNSSFRLLLENPHHRGRTYLIETAAEEVGTSVQEVESALAAELADMDAASGGGSVEDITPLEWVALTEPPGDSDPQDNFIARGMQLWRPASAHRLAPVADQIAQLLAGVTLVDKLREVRVLRGFERLTTKQLVPANLDPHPGFLPGVEVFGEGYFLRLDEEALAHWESRSDLAARCATLRSRQDVDAQTAWLADPAPRFVLLHTFAHLLLRQTAFEAGYSTSSLRERLYSTSSDDGPRMAGILIYTAAGDTEGTLGGLARIGEPERLVGLIGAALTAAHWCSFDPVCGESSGQGPGGLSLAACHACALVPETSCVQGNRLLDRRLVVDEEFGFFRHVLAAIEDMADGSTR